jgi:16S rRNA (cytosine1402-N4)-methyltransferase
MKKKKAKSQRVRPDKSRHIEYDYHLPVLLDESVDNLVQNANGIYVDGTLGGGGHAELILSKLDFGGSLIAFDKDRNAVEHCERKLKHYVTNDAAPKLTIYNECFSNVCEKSAVWGKFSGLLLDLGVSSKQLDTESAGLSYRVDSPLDMRFGNHGKTAEELLKTADVADLTHVLRFYGEEPNSARIARRIVEMRRVIPLNSTFELRDIITSLVPVPLHYKTLSRVFQAIRIAVNDELNILERTLNCIVDNMLPGGRIVVISYHSLEDRIVKNFMRTNATKENKRLVLITKKPTIPSEEEIATNPRARSAKLRVAEVV